MASTADGLSWLSSQVNGDNNYTTGTYIASPMQSLSEMVTAISVSGEVIDPTVVLQINGDDYNSTEHLSRKIFLSVQTGAQTASLANQLLEHQNLDGSFGELEGYDGSVLDTAYALQALSLSQSDLNAQSKAISYLLYKQNSDGGWSDGMNISAVELTAIAMHALWHTRKNFNVSVALENAKSFLINQRQANYLWQSDHQSALALIAIAPTLSTNTSLLGSINALEQAQQPDYSWSHDIYTTALVIQALTIAAQSQPNPDLATISGKVVDGDNGLNLSNVSVSIAGISTVSTDNDGSFAFTGLQAGEYSLTVQSDNHAPMLITIRLVGEDVDLGTLRMNKNPDVKISTLKGSVKSVESGILLDGVSVSLGGREVFSDSNGEYTIDGIAAGSYILTLKKAGYLQKQIAITIAENTTLYYNVQLSSIDFPIEATVQGEVIDSNTTLPLQGVTIALSGAVTSTLNTQSDGKFSFNQLAAGTYSIEISKDGYRTQLIPITIDQSNMIDLQMIALETLNPDTTTVKLSGVITQTQTKLPLEGVTVTVGSSTVLTDSNGYYELLDLPSGMLSIDVSKTGYDAVSAQVETTPGMVVSFSPALNKIDSEAALYGTIFSSDTSEPLRYVEIKYSGEDNGTAYTDGDGYYYIGGLHVGDIALKYSKDGYESLLFDITVNAGTNLSPTLTPVNMNTPENNATLEGIVVDMITNEPITDVHVSINGIKTNTEITSDVDGLLSLSGIRSYDLNLSFQKDGYKTIDTIVHLNENEFFNMGPVSMRPLSDRELYPDLTVMEADLSQVFITQQELSLTGSMDVTVLNQGGVATTTAFELTAFYDQNRDGIYTDQSDILLGQTSTSTTIDVDKNVTLSVSLAGSMPYVNAPVSIWIDSKTNIVENNESNNVVAFNKQCGVVSTVVISSHQSLAVKEAIVRGSDYIAPQTMSWDRTNRCLGCHVQTQTLVGLQSSMAKANVDTVTGEYLLAKILSSQQSDGSVRRSHPEYSKTQTAFALWSLSYVPDNNRTFDVRANALRYMYSRRQTSGNQVYWTQDHNSGWMRTPEAVSVVVAFGTSRYLKSVGEQSALTSVQQDMVNKYTALLPTMTRYLLNRAAVSQNNINASLLLVGLGELKRHITDPSLLQEVTNAMAQLDTSLRSKQNVDGGWSYTTWKGSSDPLTSAWVGFALNYLSPLQTDQAVLKNIQFLLDNQRTNGTWVTNSGLFSTHLATTSLVMAYLPVALDFLDSADLSVSLLQLLEQPDGTLTLSARIANGGSDKLRVPTSVSFYDGDPMQNGTLIAEENILSLDKWDYFDQHVNNITAISQSNIYAVVDERNWIHECNELNNHMNIPAVASKLYASITASTNNTTYGAFEDVNLSASVVNLGRLSSDFTVQFEIIDASGTLVQSLGEHELGILVSGETRQTDAVWNTSLLLNGNYQLKAILTDRNGNVVDTSIANFSIAVESTGVAAATVSAVTNKTIYHTTDTVYITDVIRNTSLNNTVDYAVLQVDVTDQTQNVRFSQSIVLGTLVPNTLLEQLNVFTYNGMSEGNFSVHAVLQDVLGNVIAADETEFVVKEDTRLALHSTMTAQLSSLDRGGVQVCTASIANGGTKSMTGLATRGLVVYADSQSEVMNQMDLVSLATGESTEIVYTIPTAGAELGEYFCIFQAEIEGTWETMAHDAYIVTEPPIQINAQVEVGTKAPLLVLVDSPQERGWCFDMFSTGYEGHDPYGPYDAPMLVDQRAYLESLLNAQGYSYKIVDNAADFKQELRSGNYSTYALFNEYINLSSQTLSEIREAVYRGDGLLFAGKHQLCNDELQKPLGLSFNMMHEHVTTMTINNTQEYTGGYITLPHEDEATRFRLQGAEALGSFEIDSGFFFFNVCPDDEKYALTRYQYKNGRGVFAAFDLLMQASVPNGPAEVETILLEALSDIQPDAFIPSKGTVYPLHLSLVNEAIATQGHTKTTFTDGNVTDPGHGMVDENGTLYWSYILPEGGTAGLDFWLKIPSDAASVDIETGIYAGDVGFESLYATIAHTINVDMQNSYTLQEALTATEAVSGGFFNFTYDNVEYHLNKAVGYESCGDYANALSHAIQAADDLAGMSTTEADGIHNKLAYAIRALYEKL